MKIFFAIFVLLWFVSEVYSDDYQPTTVVEIESITNYPKYYLSLNFTNCVPQRDFQDNINSSGIGFSIGGGFILNPIPVSLGLNLDVIYFYYNPSLSYYDGIDIISTKTTVIPIDVVLKFQPALGELLPYFEVLGGYSFISASSEYEPDNSYRETFKESYVDGAFHYGFGGGIMIKLIKPKSNDAKDKNKSLYFDIRARYFFGDFSYYKTVTLQNDYPVFKDHSSKTDMINVNIGFTFIF